MSFTIALITYEFIVVSVFSFFNKIKKRWSYYLLVFVLLCLFLSFCYFRPVFFRDTEIYSKVYNNAQWSDLKHINLLAKEPKSDDEYGFVLLILLFRSVGFSFRAFSALITIINVIAMFIFVTKICELFNDADTLVSGRKKNPNFLSFFSVYLPIFGVFYNFVAIRGSLSFSLLSLATVFVVEKKYIKCILLAFLAFCVQRLSLLGFIPIFLLAICKKKIKKSYFLVIWIVLGIVLFINFWFNTLAYIGVYLQTIWNSFMVRKVYLGIAESTNHSLKRFLLFFGYWFNGAVFLGRKKEHSINIFILIYFITLLMSSFVNGYTASYRIIDYFYMYMLPINYRVLYNNGKKISISSIIVFLSLSMFIVSWGLSFIQWYLFD